MQYHQSVSSASRLLHPPYLRSFLHSMRATWSFRIWFILILIVFLVSGCLLLSPCTRIRIWLTTHVIVQQILSFLQLLLLQKCNAQVGTKFLTLAVASMVPCLAGFAALPLLLSSSCPFSPVGSSVSSSSSSPGPPVCSSSSSSSSSSSPLGGTSPCTSSRVSLR